MGLRQEAGGILISWNLINLLHTTVWQKDVWKNFRFFIRPSCFHIHTIHKSYRSMRITLPGRNLRHAACPMDTEVLHLLHDSQGWPSASSPFTALCSLLKAVKWRYFVSGVPNSSFSGVPIDTLSNASVPERLWYRPGRPVWSGLWSSVSATGDCVCILQFRNY